MKPKIVVALLTSSQEFQQMQAAEARPAAQRVGLDLEIVFAENNAIQQIHQLYQFVHAPEEGRPKAILVEAVSREGMERLARNALKAGIAWVVQQWKTDYVQTLRAENPAVPVLSVAADEEEIGRIQAQQLRTLLPAGGAVLLVQGPLESETAVHRLQGLQQALEGSGIELKRILNGDWTADGAAAAVKGWLRLKSTEGVGIDLVASQNDSMAAGARKAILELRKEWAGLPFTGCDGLPEGGRRMVAAGQLVATVVKPTTTGPAIELIAGWLEGRSVANDLVLHAQSYPPLERLAAVAGVAASARRSPA